MTDFPSSAKAVVVGAGIVGNSMVHHLARLGWRDLVLLDKGALPNPGGSTGHASNFIFPVDHSKEMTALTRDSTDQYIELGVHTDERRDRGRADAGAAGGVQPAHHLVDLVGRAVGAAHAGAGEGARAVHQRGDHPRRLLHARRRLRRLAPRRHADARGRDGARRADDLRGHRGDGHRRRERARPARAHRQGPDRDGVRLRLLRRLEPADRDAWPAPRSRSRPPSTR